MKKYNKKFLNGVTLIELLMGVLIFSIILSSIVAIFGGLTKTQFRASAISKLISATRSPIEIMSKEIRLASKNTTECSGFSENKNYEIWNGSSWISDLNASGTGIRFVDFSGRCVIYKLVGNSIEKTIKKGATTIGPDIITGKNVNIPYLNFTVIGDNKGISQPRVVIKIKASAVDASVSDNLSFEFQSTLSQRAINE